MKIHNYYKVANCRVKLLIDKNNLPSNDISVLASGLMISINCDLGECWSGLYVSASFSSKKCLLHAIPVQFKTKAANNSWI